MKNTIILTWLLSLHFLSQAQTNPAILSWMQNTTIKGRHYVAGNSTAINDTALVNVQKVQYSADWVYLSTNGIPSYVTGPFQDGNPSFATAQNALFKLSLNPTVNSGTKTKTTPGNIGLFINGVALFDYRDGVAWNTAGNALCGGPGNPPCPGGPGANMPWNRDAIPAEKNGFDCAKGHPAMGNYHHHQNPSAFKLDLNVISTVCSLYDADGLYVIDSTKHSPLIGFAYDGFPIYGAYGYKNADGTGGIVRMKSGYQKRNISVRTHHADGTDVDDGPAINSTYFLGYFREDYEFINHAGQADYLDVHNGRFCKTPEYPNGMYCYFATVDEKWNSAYPYVVGLTFYGNVTAEKPTTITETVNTYSPASNAIINMNIHDLEMRVFPNPANDIIAVQISGINYENLTLELCDMAGKVILTSTIFKGSTISYLDTKTLYNNMYLVKLKSSLGSTSQKVMIIK